jgi:DNA-binding NarL/FixJ family response regulator
MTSPSNGGATASGASDDLKGVSILVVEDSWLVGKAMLDLLELKGAEVTGPAATTAEAERLLAHGTPNFAIVDLNLRDGERANALIDQLHARGVRVLVISGYTVQSVPPEKVAAMLQKPVSDALLLSSLRLLAAHKAAPEA